jgi:hypothetical protein
MAIAGDSSQFMALRRDGTVVEWYTSGAATNLHPEISNAVAVASGYGSRFVLKADGTVSGYGLFYPYVGSPTPTTPPAGLSNVIAVAAGYSHALALRADGTVTTWGPNWFGAGSIPAGLSNVVSISAWEYGSAALKSDGTITTWGGVGSASGISNAIAITLAHSMGMALNAQGTISIWEYPYIARDITNVSATAGGSHDVVLAGFMAPFFTMLPSLRALNAGSDAFIGPSITGTAPLSYQWRFYGTNLPNATNSLLSLHNLQSADTGPYSLIVSNPFGSATGTVANVVISPTTPTILQQPLSQTVTQGYPVLLTVDARGSTPLGYQTNGTLYRSSASRSVII